MLPPTILDLLSLELHPGIPSMVPLVMPQFVLLSVVCAVWGMLPTTHVPLVYGIHPIFAFPSTGSSLLLVVPRIFSVAQLFCVVPPTTFAVLPAMHSAPL